MSQAQSLFSAAQIARALGRKRQVVQKMLSDTAAEKTVVRGNEARAWGFAQLPESMRAELLAASRRLGFADVHALLSVSPTVWICPMKWNDVRDSFKERALKLRAALQIPIVRQHEISSVELLRIGLAEFQKEFGYAISGKQWNRIFERTMRRDGGCENFQRIEIYLDDAAFRCSPVKAAVVPLFHLHRPLDEIFSNLENKTTPTAEDREWIFDCVFNHFEKLFGETNDSRLRKRIKKSLIAYLFSAVPSLSKTESALRRVFEINLTKWRVNGRQPAGLMDLRRLKSGNFRAPDFAADKKKIVESAILHGGNESLAYRKLRQAGELSPEFIGHYHFDPRRNKSYAPKTIRDEITPQVEMCGPLHRGPWEAKMRGPYIPRDWSAVSPGDWFSGDDVTWNNYFYFYDNAGELHIERGECLLLIDLRTGCPLDFVLIAGKYNGRHLKSLITKVHDKYGLPHEGLYFEKGVWESRWVTDLARPKLLLHWRDTENGLRASGVNLDVRHATTPRAKTIEGLIRILQERQRSEPGFVGFNERTKEQERMQEFIARARRGKEHPGNKLLEMEEWARRIASTLEEFGNDPQNGKMLPGISPFEGWQQGLERRPLRQLAPECRYMLATHKEPVTVRQEGIKLTIGNERMLYANEETGKLIGRKVLAFYNVDNPDLLTVSDLNRQNYFTVKRILLPAMSASKEQLAEAHAQISGHKKTARTIYGNIKSPMVYTIQRPALEDEKTRELGRFHNEQEEKFKTEQSEVTRKLRKIQTLAALTGAPVNQAVRNPDLVLNALRREQEIMERIRLKELPQTKNQDE